MAVRRQHRKPNIIIIIICFVADSIFTVRIIRPTQWSSCNPNTRCLNRSRTTNKTVMILQFYYNSAVFRLHGAISSALYILSNTAAYSYPPRFVMNDWIIEVKKKKSCVTTAVSLHVNPTSLWVGNRFSAYYCSQNSLPFEWLQITNNTRVYTQQILSYHGSKLFSSL